MRINKYVALATGMSRRAADAAIAQSRVLVNGQIPAVGYNVRQDDTVTLDGGTITPAVKVVTLILNKPVGYVVSRNGQGSPTIYDLLPSEYHLLKPVGRLDKDSSGLLLLTNDGNLANELTHPKYQKDKVYEVSFDKPLTSEDQKKIEQGIAIDDYVSRLRLSKNENCELKIENCSWIVTMSMGRNRQIRRTFAALGYKVTELHRTHFGSYQLGNLEAGEFELA